MEKTIVLVMVCFFVFSFNCVAQVNTLKTTVKTGTVVTVKSVTNTSINKAKGVKITDDAPAPDTNAVHKVSTGMGVTVTDDAPAEGKIATGIKAHDDGPTPGGDKIVIGQTGPQGQILYQGVNGTKYYINNNGGKIFLTPAGK